MKYGVSNKDDPKAYRKMQSRSRRAKDPVRYLYNQAKYRAKQRGHEFDIDLGDLEIPDVCPVFGIPLFFTEGGRTDNSYSIDRIDNSKGYVKGNVRVISFRANQMKSNLTLQEAESLYKYMKGE